MRNVDALLFDSPVCSFKDGPSSPDEQTFILQPRTLDTDITFYLEAGLKGDRALRIEIPLDKLPSIDPASSEEQLTSIAVETALTEETGIKTAPSCVMEPSRFTGRPALHVIFPVEPYQYGELRGSIQVGEHRIDLNNGSNRYVYAAPDKQELSRILVSHGMEPA